jgi:hypothetical protein
MASIKKDRPSKSQIIRSAVEEILELYEAEGLEPPDFHEIVEILAEAGFEFSIRTDFLQIALGVGISPIKVTWNSLVIWRDRPWRGKRGKGRRRKTPKKFKE